MARSTDDSDDRTKRRRNDPGYEVLPDDDDEGEALDAKYRRRQRLRREDRDDDYASRKWQRKRRRFPWVVNVLGIVCALSTLVTAPLALLGLVALIGRPNKFTVALPVIFGGLTVFFGRIAWGVWRRRASGDLLKRSGILSAGTGAMMCFIGGPWTLGALERGDVLKTPSNVMAVICVSGIWLLGIGLLALFTRERLRQWAGRDRRYAG